MKKSVAVCGILLFATSSAMGKGILYRVGRAASSIGAKIDAKLSKHRELLPRTARVSLEVRQLRRNDPERQTRGQYQLDGVYRLFEGLGAAALISGLASNNKGFALAGAMILGAKAFDQHFYIKPAVLEKAFNQGTQLSKDSLQFLQRSLVKKEKSLASQFRTTNTELQKHQQAKDSWYYRFSWNARPAEKQKQLKIKLGKRLDELKEVRATLQKVNRALE